MKWYRAPDFPMGLPGLCSGCPFYFNFHRDRIRVLRCSLTGITLKEGKIEPKNELRKSTALSITNSPIRPKSCPLIEVEKENTNGDK